MITTYNDNLKSSPSGIYTYTITENKIVTLTLDRLKRDLDLQIRLPGTDQILHSSTKANTKNEALTTWLPAGSYEIIVKEPSRGDSETESDHTTFAYTLTIDDESFQAQSSFPNDPLLPYQWHLFNTAERSKEIELTPFSPTIPFDSFRPEADIKTPPAWKVRSKASGITIAIIDNGIDINHPDLKENIWINPGEIAGDGKDNDGNGYKDDVHGWSFINESPDFTPDDDHGTHIAGIAAASGNNGEGITGVAWEAQIMALDVDSDGDKNTEEMEAEAIRYAVDNGAKVINISLGENLKESPDEYLKRESILKPAFQYAYDNDVFISIAAGNEGGVEEAQEESYWEEQGNLDKYALHTASFSELFSNIATVVALNQYGRKASYSSYGQRTTIGAPGGDSEEKAETYYAEEYEYEWSYNHGILSTVPTGTGDAKFGGNYDYANGTSMAAPIIAGMAALIRAADTRISAPDTIAILRASADKNPALSPYVNGGLSANLQEALLIAEFWDGPQTLTSLEQSQESPVLNLSYLTNAQRIQGTLRVTREAALDPITGFYKTLDAKGTVQASNGTLLSPGDDGYELAALAANNLVTSLDKVSLKNGGKITKNFELGSSSYLAPFAKVAGNTWFAFEEANWDGFAHFKLLSPNKFGLEDLAYGGDQDFNDHILHFDATAII